LKTYTKNILEELENILPEKDRSQIIESRGNHIITSAINLIETIQEHYGEQIADEMERRLLNGIKAKSADKFSRSAKKISESRTVK
jgi:protoporphyrinogen oxidase